VLHKGKSADDNHPLVLERPTLFGDDAPSADLSGPKVVEEAPVERATRAPGEKRAYVRKPKDDQNG
jgi:hypothetical protein